MKDEKIIKDMLKEAQSYFGDDEKIYIYKCKKCKKYDPVPGFVVSEQLGFLKFSKQKVTPGMECPYCGGKSFPIDLNNI